jgi:hypothetical protein
VEILAITIIVEGIIKSDGVINLEEINPVVVIGDYKRTVDYTYKPNQCPIHSIKMFFV